MLTPLPFLLRNHAFAMARHMLGKEITCAICLSTPIDLCYLGCNHGFCRECLDNWTAKSGNHQCPMCRRPICFSLWYSVIDVGLAFLRIHCTYEILHDVLYCFHWWTIMHFFAVCLAWAMRIRVGNPANFLSNNILIVFVSARMLSELFKCGFYGRVVIDLVLCAGTPCLWVHLASFRIGELFVIWNIGLVCYKLLVIQVLSSCGVLLLFVASLVEARCRWYHTKGVLRYYSQMS